MTHKANIIINHEPDEHAFASPSKFETLESCPYFAKCSATKKEEPSAAAERGRLLHEAVYNDDVYASLFPEDREAVDYARQTDIEPYDEEGYTIEFERKVNICDREGKVVSFGTIDQLVYTEDQSYILVIDRKFGRYPVKVAEANRQLYGYSLGVFQEFPNCLAIGARISQPAVKTNGEVAEFTREENYEDLLDYVCRVVERAENATPEDANPSPDNCKWCNKEACEACQNKTNADFDTITAVVKSDQFSGEPTPEGVAFGDGVLRKIELAQSFLKTAEAKVRAYIFKAGGSEHYRINAGRSTKTTDWKAVAEECNIPGEVIEAHTVVRLGEPYLTKVKSK